MAAKKKADEKQELTQEEEIIKFVLDNEEKILEILRTKENETVSVIEKEAEKGKQFVKGVFEAITDREVTQHFMTMGIEFMLGMGALVKALPWPEEMKPFVDMVGEQKDALSTVMCRNNPNCGVKYTSTIEKIELD